MFGTIRKHQSWLWFIIIAVMVLSMIVWQNQLGKSGNQPGAGGNFGSIDNKPVTLTEYQGARNEASLAYLTRNREWPDSPGASANFDIERETYQRLFLIRKVQQYNIHVDPDSVAQLAAMFLREFGQNGQSASLDTLLEELKPHGVTAEDFQNFLQHDLGIQQLASVIGVSGKLVTPAEIESLYVHEYQELTADVVFFSASNFLARVPEPNAAALSQFYTNQQAAYRLPDQLQVSYVFYNVTNFMPEAEKQLGTNINRAADEALTKLGTNGLRFGKTPEEARLKIREILIQETAISNAYVKAVAFQTEVADKHPSSPDNLSAVAKEKGMETKVTQPFDKEYGPSEFSFGQSFPVASLFSLTPDEPFPDGPIRGVNGVYVLAYNKMIPSRIPPLEEIHSRILSDYKYMQSMRLAQINGRMFAQTATNEIAHGKTFAAACAADKVSPVVVPPFSLSTETLPEAVEEHVEAATFKQIAFSTQVGAVSDFAPTRSGGFVVHVSQRLPVDQAKMKTQLSEFSNVVRQRRQTEAFELWFQKEASEALRDIPAFQPRNRPVAAR